MKRLREDRLRCGADKYSAVKIMTKDLTVSDKCWHTTIKYSGVKIMDKDLTVGDKCWYTTIKDSALVLT